MGESLLSVEVSYSQALRQGGVAEEESLCLWWHKTAKATRANVEGQASFSPMHSTQATRPATCVTFTSPIPALDHEPVTNSVFSCCRKACLLWLHEALWRHPDPDFNREWGTQLWGTWIWRVVQIPIKNGFKIYVKTFKVYLESDEKTCSGFSYIAS